MERTISKSRRLVLIILAIVLALATATLGVIYATKKTAKADTTDEVNIYFSNTLDWQNVKCYYWTSNNTNLCQWPGKDMTLVEGTSIMFTISVPSGCSVVFNNGEGTQTVDLYEMFEGIAFEPTGTNVEGKVTAKDFTYQPPQNETSTIYFESNESWGKVYCYAWEGSKEFFGSWPGKEMTFAEREQFLYCLDVPATASVVFNNGNGTQTVDVIEVKNNYRYSLGNLSYNKYEVNESVCILYLNDAEDFVNFATNKNAWNAYVYVEQDLDLSGIEINPIGNKETPFTGNFIGQDSFIRNLTVNGNDYYTGIFGVCENAVIITTNFIDITVNHKNICSHGYVGGVVGTLNSGTIVNIVFDGDINVYFNSEGDLAYLYVGGIVAQMDTGIIALNKTYAHINIDCKVSGEMKIDPLSAKLNNIERSYGNQHLVTITNILLGTTEKLSFIY